MSRSLSTALIAGILFPLHEWLKGHDTVHRRRALERSQWRSPGQLETERDARLRDFLLEIGRDVPYYRRLFAERRFNPACVRAASDLNALPLLTKAAIRANSEAMTSETAGPLKRYNTGGSSGEPLILYMGRDRISHDVAAKWRATRWWGVDIGDPEIVVWGSPIELSRQDRMRRLRDALLRSTLLPAFEMSSANLQRFVVAIRRVRPRMLFGYPSALALIAQHAQACGQRMDDLAVQVAFVTAERLYDDQKAVIEQVFGCRVANGYGARDAGFIAHECPHGSLHVNAEDIIVEIVGADGCAVAPGTSGEIVVTNLATREFPFVRYCTGDIGAFDDGPCPCGRGLPRLTAIEGRTTDFVVAQDGTVMHGLALIYTVRDLPGIERFRIVQHNLATTEVQVVATSAFRVEHEQRIIDEFKERLGSGVRVDVTRIDHIAAERSGKYRHVISHVPPSLQSPAVAGSRDDGYEQSNRLEAASAARPGSSPSANPERETG